MNRKNYMRLATYAAAVAFFAAAMHAQGKTVAVTFDDLPVSTIGPDFSPGAQQKASAIVTSILTTLRAHHVPAMGMVNEKKVHAGGTYSGEVNADRAALLEQWVNAGRTLGSHSFAHLHLSEISLEKAEQELVEGEKVSAPIMAKHGWKVHFYRYPFNDTGGSEEKKKGFEAILEKHGYTIAPMTIQNDDWMYNVAYEVSDAATKQKLRDTYLAETNQQIEFTDKVIQQLFHHPIAQVLLIHSNQLNADTLDATLTAFEKHGYTFVDLPTAVKDPAYKTPDLYTGKQGMSWLERWRIALQKQQPIPGETPAAPKWVQDAYNEALKKK